MESAQASSSKSAWCGRRALPRTAFFSGDSRLRLGRRRHFGLQGRRGRAWGSLNKLDIQAVIPTLQGDATEQTPPDLPSYLFKERIVYLGMTLVPQVTELILAELLYLQYDSEKTPIIMYINSTGVTKAGDKLGYEAETLAIYDTMKYVKPPIYTICVGTAFGEAAVLLAAGKKGYRASLPSATIMLRQPMQRFTQMQATDIDIYRNELRRVKKELVTILATHTGKNEETIEQDINRPRYFDPYQAVEYGLIDKVLEPGDGNTRDLVEGTRFGMYQWEASKNLS